MFSQPRVLLISSDEADTSDLKAILSEYVVLRSVRGLPEFGNHLEGGGYDAVFCGWSFHRGIWSDALRQVQQRNPDLPVIIFCRTGGEREWVEVMEAGGFDLLAAPYLKPTVLALLEQAVGSYQARQLQNLMPKVAAQAS